MEPPPVHVVGHDRFEESVRHVQSYVRAEPGAHTRLVEAAHRDPEGVTVSLVALGAVLLDLAAGAFSLSPDEVLAKVCERVAACDAGRSVSPLSPLSAHEAHEALGGPPWQRPPTP